MPPTRQITHERESPFSWHTRNCITPERQDKGYAWADGEREYMKDKLDFTQLRMSITHTVTASPSGSSPPVEGSVYSLMFVMKL